MAALKSTPYQYSPLPHGRWIRIIELQPSGKSEDPIRIHLKAVALGEQPSYEALSYAWEGQIPDQSIDCETWSLLVSQTCLNAMRRLRLKKDVRVLWIDGICIDQRSTEEKNHQVALMGQIYRNCRQVIIWTGEGQSGVDLIFRFVSKLPWHVTSYYCRHLVDRLAATHLYGRKMNKDHRALLGLFYPGA